MDAIYRLNGNIAETSKWAAGPWNAGHQHGSAPSSLIAHAVERLPTPQPMRVARLTIDLMRPVPIAPLEIRTEILREGRKIQLIGMTLCADDVPVVRATVLKIRDLAVDLPDNIHAEPVTVPGPREGATDANTNASNPFLSGLSIQEARGGFRIPGPAAVWFRANRPIIAGADISPLMRAVITADFCNGTASVLDFNKFTFINADLTISLARMPVGDWILLDAESWIGPAGAAIAFGKLADTKGYFGRAIQSLVIDPR